MDVSVVRGGSTTLRLALLADRQPFTLLSTATALLFAINSTETIIDDITGIKTVDQVLINKLLADVTVDSPAFGTVSVPLTVADTQGLPEGQYIMQLQITTPTGVFQWICSDRLFVMP